MLQQWRTQTPFKSANTSINNKTMTSVSSLEASAAAVFLIFSLESV